MERKVTTVKKKKKYLLYFGQVLMPYCALAIFRTC